MKNPAVLKYLQVFAIAIAVIVADQCTKHVAETRLASERPGHFSNYVELTVPPHLDGATVREFVTYEFGLWNSDREIDHILSGVTDDGAVLLPANARLETGDVIEVRRRKVTVIPGVFELDYTRNEGGAFSFLSDAEPAWRVPFFVVVSTIAVLLVLWILRGVALRQQLLVWGLSFIFGGAIGNLIDRVRLEYVVDFIALKWTDAHQWPTFNIADAAIVIGVFMMISDMIIEHRRERREAAVEGDT